MIRFAKPLPAACRLKLLLVSVFLCLPVSWPALGQSDDEVPTVTRTFALEGARVVQAPGRVLEKATVVVRDGLILAVGPNVPIPFDAERIAADSLVVYAGFIDGLSHAAIPKPKSDDQRKSVDHPGDPPPDRAGIQPDRDARDLLAPDDKTIEQLREAGFTLAHTVPHDGMLPGTGALILLTGDDVNTLVYRGDVSLFAQFDDADGVYPSTEMALMAKLRQLYREAERRHRLEALYAERPAGMERPPYDPVHHALFPVVEGQKPVFFHTRSALDVHRALDLQETLGFPLVLSGLAQGFDVVERLKTTDVPLLLTLDLPEDKTKADSAAADTTGTPETAPPDDSTQAVAEEPSASHYVTDLRTRSWEDVEEEKRNLEARQALVRKKYYNTAARLHEAGLRFGFTTVDVKPGDIWKHLRLMVDHGLPEETALAALTTHPAEILGIAASAGTVEPGKLANLVVTTGPLFDEDTRIRYVFVDGRKFEIEPEDQKGEGEAAVNPAGTWSFTVESPDGPVHGTLTLSGSPDNLTGTITSSVMPSPITLDSVDLNGPALEISFDAGQMGRISVSVTISGDEMEGTVNGRDFSGLPLTATRTAGPDRP